MESPIFRHLRRSDRAIQTALPTKTHRIVRTKSSAKFRHRLRLSVGLPQEQSDRGRTKLIYRRKRRKQRKRQTRYSDKSSPSVWSRLLASGKISREIPLFKTGSRKLMSSRIGTSSN